MMLNGDWRASQRVPCLHFLVSYEKRIVIVIINKESTRDNVGVTSSRVPRVLEADCHRKFLIMVSTTLPSEHKW